MTVHLDTSILIDALTGPRRSLGRLRALVAQGERLAVCTIVQYEWRRGPRDAAELATAEALVPTDRAVAFGAREADVAASLCRRVQRPRGRELDLAIAACALCDDAAFWTLNPRDFRDVPGLTLL